jgi:rubrerythrin
MFIVQSKVPVRRRSTVPIPKMGPLAACAVALLGVSACAAETKQLPPPLDPASAEAPEGGRETPRSLAGPLPREAAPLEQPASQPSGMADHADMARTGGHAAHEGASPKDSAAGDASDAGTMHMNGPENAQRTVYSCPMHPEIRQDRPGSCPKCGMKLVPDTESQQKSRAVDRGASTGTAGDHPGGGKATPKIIYTCPMHPEVRQDRPGKCPKCGMKLVPEQQGSASGKHDGHP